MKFKPTSFCIRGNRIIARQQEPYGKDRKTLKLILKFIVSIFYKH